MNLFKITTSQVRQLLLVVVVVVVVLVSHRHGDDFFFVPVADAASAAFFSTSVTTTRSSFSSSSSSSSISSSGDRKRPTMPKKAAVVVDGHHRRHTTSRFVAGAAAADFRSRVSTTSSTSSLSMSSSSNENNDDDDDDKNNNKFGFQQRIESVKALVLGGVAGSVVMAPFSAVQDLLFLNPLAPISTNGIAQWEFDCDTGSFQAGLFAIVYRYCIREDTYNPQLKSGVVSAFVLTRTLSRIVVSPYCTAIPLDCGSPLGYLNWPMIGQLVANGIVSYALFQASASAIDYATNKGYMSKFPG